VNENGEKTFKDHDMVPSGEISIEDKSVWYPAVAAEGEGIFITAKNPFDSLDLNDVEREWIENRPNYQTDNNRTDRKYVKTPLFVWWHSFSHILIKRLAYKSGYSEASIRERVYVDPTTKEGGILLYNTSTGEDSSLGGLIGLVDDFNEILNDCVDTIKICSSDPLCIDTHISKDKVNGAACIYCLLLPETSCEDNNMWLDRHLLLGK
jgi:hypothetical protein